MDIGSNNKTLEKKFFSDGYRLAMEAPVNKADESILFSAIKEMYEEIDQLTDILSEYSGKQGVKIHCKKGCAWCCHQPVFALKYELDYLAHYIKKNFTVEKQKEIQKKAQEKVKKLQRLKKEELLNSKHPCPLLEDGACSAYKARPMACRIYLSTNVKSCMKFYHEPNDKKSFPALLDFPMRAGRMMNEGFKSALKSNGIVSRESRIEEKLTNLTKEMK